MTIVRPIVRPVVRGVVNPVTSRYFNWADYYWAQLKAELSDGNTVALYDRTRPEGVVKNVSGVESIYWDLMVGSSLRGAEQDSGVIIVYAVYEITACEADFFYVGNQVGDIFPCGTVKTCDANNKVKRVTGNHLTQPDLTKAPVNGVFNATDQFMKTPPLTWAQPALLYLVIKQVSWTAGSQLLDGRNYYTAAIHQHSVSPKIRMQVGGYIDSFKLRVGKYGILQALFNTASSYIKINEYVQTDGSINDSTLGGFTLGCSGGVSYFSNIEFDSGTLRDVADNTAKRASIYRSLLVNSLGIGDTKIPMVGFICDDTSDLGYSLAKPLLETYGFKGSFAPILNTIDTLNQFTTAQLLEMQSDGHEILSHTVTHTDLTTITIPEAITELEDSKTGLEALGLTINNFVYPYNGTNTDLEAEVLKVYEAGWGPLAVNGIQELPIDRLGLVSRKSIDTTSLADLKDRVDIMLAANGLSLLVFYGHPVNWDAAKIQDITDLFDYIQSKELTINTCKQILDKVKGYKPIEY